MPTANCPFRSSKTIIDNRQARLLSVVFGRLKPGVQVAQAQADVAGVAGNLQSTYPDVYPKQIGYATQVDRLDAVLTQEARPTFLILLGTTVLVLLIVSPTSLISTLRACSSGSPRLRCAQRCEPFAACQADGD